MTDRELMQAALEALDRVMSHGAAVQEAKDILRERLAQPDQLAEGLTVGNFALSRYDEGSYWLAHKDGEGMQVRQDRLQALVDNLWADF